MRMRMKLTIEMKIRMEMKKIEKINVERQTVIIVIISLGSKDPEG